MAFASRRRLGTLTIGWNVFFSHPEAEAIAASELTLPEVVGAAGPTVLAILSAIPHESFGVTCAAGGHNGVKAIVLLDPPGSIVVTR